MVGCSWETPTAADESYEDYLRRREQLISERLRILIANPSSPDHHRKGGCFDCELLWFGDAVRTDLHAHLQAFPGHTTWIIEAPEA